MRSNTFILVFLILEERGCTGLVKKWCSRVYVQNKTIDEEEIVAASYWYV